MESNTAIDALAALAQDTRLAVFRLLVRAEPRGLAAGEIARQLQVPPNTLSSHLAVLTQAGLLDKLRDGRSIIYRVRLDRMRRLIDFLMQDCCEGHPEICGDAATTPRCR